MASVLAVACAFACAEGNAPSFPDAGDEASAAEDAGADGAPDAPCPPGYATCDTSCVDLNSSPEHCGACGRACAAGEVCNEGRCAGSCTPGLTDCMGACVDLQTDEAHCGGCGLACGAGESCIGGACLCVPACAGRECGSDGCGGTCPPGCSGGWICGAAGRCECAGLPCGSACCYAGQVCTGSACCTPACAGRECGPDGCGGSCGSCASGWGCSGSGACVFESLTFEAESGAMGHIVGRAEADGWSANTAADSEGHMLYGPYTRDVPAGSRSAAFRMMIDNNSADTLRVVTLDVYDFTTTTVLAQRGVRRNEFSSTMTYQEFYVPFTAPGGSDQLEFRVLWHDYAYIRVDRVTIR
ncbi:MAG: hypothetical protein GYA57_14875 [Myxococcales bacterium]|nr:hypothetical protein [Myxococcales bacterium]